VTLPARADDFAGAASPAHEGVLTVRIRLGSDAHEGEGMETRIAADGTDLEPYRRRERT
jgi:hypothetical protein